VGRHGDAWKIRVTARPTDGKPNDAVLRLLADRLQIPSDDLALVSGGTARDKIVELTGIDADETDRRLSIPEGSPER
jgi:uncharacterized protein YggU (UPF0235/DUF167 family)